MMPLDIISRKEKWYHCNNNHIKMIYRRTNIKTMQVILFNKRAFRKDVISYTIYPFVLLCGYYLIVSLQVKLTYRFFVFFLVKLNNISFVFTVLELFLIYTVLQMCTISKVIILVFWNYFRFFTIFKSSIFFSFKKSSTKKLL